MLVRVAGMPPARRNRKVNKWCLISALDVCGKGPTSHHCGRWRRYPMDVSIVLTIGDAIAGAIGGITIGGRLQDSSFGKAVNAFIGSVGGVTLVYLLATSLPDLASSLSKGSLGAVLGCITGALVGAGVLITICALVKDNLWSVRKDRLRR